MDTPWWVTLVEAGVTAVVTLAAAFYGAWYAFKLTDREKARETVSQQVASVNRALFVLTRQFNALESIRRQVIDPVRHHPQRYLAMRATLPRKATSRMELEGLLFLLETDDRELLFELMIEEERFETAVQALNERSRLHLEKVQPKLEAAGMEEKLDYPGNWVTSVLGSPLATHLERSTDETIEHIDLTIASNLDFARRFRAAMKARFPGRTIIGFEPRAAANPKS